MRFAVTGPVALRYRLALWVAVAFIMSALGLWLLRPREQVEEAFVASNLHEAERILNESDYAMRLRLLKAAAREGRSDLVSLLLDNGIDPNVRLCAAPDDDFDDDRMALHEASISGHEDVVRVLLQRGAEINRRTVAFGRRGYTPLELAVIGGHPDIVNSLLDAGAMITPESVAFAVEARDRQVLDLLLQKGGMPGQEPLVAAAKAGDKEVLHVLLKAGTDINLADATGMTALHVLAFGRQSCEGLGLLLSNGADPAIRDSLGLTALHYASTYGSADKVKLLLEHGACVNVKDLDGYVPLDYAEARNRGKIAEILREQGGRRAMPLPPK